MFNRLLVILILIALTVVYSLYQTSNLESQLAEPDGQASSILAKLPAATFIDLEGKPLDLHQMYKNESISLLVVHFWGTWCGPCEAELPELLSLINKFEKQPGIRFLLVAVNDDINKVKKHIKGLQQTNAIWLLENNNAHRDLFGTTRVPETFVFSSDMITLRKYVGPQEWNKTQFFQSFDDFLQISTRKL